MSTKTNRLPARPQQASGGALAHPPLSKQGSHDNDVIILLKISSLPVVFFYKLEFGLPF